MAGGGTGIRKYVGALKDTTTVSIAKVNSDYKVTMTENFRFIFRSSHVAAVVLNCSCLAILSLVTGAGYCYCEGHKPC
jgi:hypothetical protein